MTIQWNRRVSNSWQTGPKSVHSMKCIQDKYFSIFCVRGKWISGKFSCGLFSVVTHRFFPHQTSRRKKIAWKSRKNWETFLRSRRKIDLPLKVMNLVFPSPPSSSLQFASPNICFYNNSLKSHEKLRQATGEFSGRRSCSFDGRRRKVSKTNFELWSSRTLIPNGHIINWWNRRRTRDRAKARNHLRNKLHHCQKSDLMDSQVNSSTRRHKSDDVWAFVDVKWLLENTFQS